MTYYIQSLSSTTREALYIVCLRKSCSSLGAITKYLCQYYQHHFAVTLFWVEVSNSQLCRIRLDRSRQRGLCRFMEHTNVTIFNKAHSTLTTELSHTHAMFKPLVHRIQMYASGSLLHLLRYDMTDE